MRRIIGLVVASVASAAYSQALRPTPSVAERAELYQRIAALQSTAELERLARDAATAAADATQAERLGLTLERYFEVDAPRAVRFAGELLPASAPWVGNLYERLARADINAALASLSEIDGVDEARIASFAVLRGLGGDARAFDLVVASLYGEARDQFRENALLQIAKQAPGRALDEALAVTNPERRRSLASVVVSQWAVDAPSEALAAVDRISDPELRRTLRASVLRGWRDSESLAAYLAALAPEARDEAVASGVLDTLAQRDPRRAADIAASLPPGEQRQRVLFQVGNSYARADPDAALAWARALDPPAPALVASAIRHVASREPLRAFDMAASLAEPERSQIYLAVIGAPRSDDTQWTSLADRVLRVEDEQTKVRLVMNVVDSWVGRSDDPSRAIDWLLAREASVPAEAFERAAFVHARSDPSGAASYVERVPSRVRSAWIGAVTAGYATTDVQEATLFLERFRGEPGFDRGAVMLATRLAATDPPGAARLLASVETRAADGASPELAIARHWAESDPAAAAAWAMELPPLQRSMAVTIVTGIWGSRDADAVRDWALRLPRGNDRDAALAAAMRVRGAAPPDAALLAAFSADRPRQAAMMNVILQTAQVDVPAARRLLAEHITDQRLREQAEQMIESFARGTAPLPGGFPGMPAGFPGSPAGIIRSPIDPLTGVAVPGQPAMVIGSSGQMLPPRPPEPGLVPLPPGAYRGRVPPIPPPRDPARSDGTEALMQGERTEAQTAER